MHGLDRRRPVRVLVAGALETDQVVAGGSVQAVPAERISPAWAALTDYVVSNIRRNGANEYEVTVAGQSAAAGGPAGTGADIVDGTVHWKYLGPTLVGANIVVGLPYTAKAVTLPPEGGNPRGTAQGAKRRRMRIVLRLNDSALPLINGKRPPDRTPATPQDTVEPRVTGDVEVRDLGWDGDGTVTIEQDLPFRTEVLAIFGTEQVNQL